WDLHGFNRLGGNSLAETIVSGWVVGKKVAQYTLGAQLDYSFSMVQGFAREQQKRIEGLISGRQGKENVYEIRKEMEQTLMDYVGIFRNGPDLQKAVSKFQELHQRSHKIGLRSNGKGANPEVSLSLRMPGMLKLALCISYGALTRTESRGSHAREDFPKRDDVNWLKRTLAYWKEGSELPELRYEPVKITELPPGDRGYGESTAPPADGNKTN
ncbi:MAG: fumarate reductase flavoprotein subunit, partial [Desulfocucumaceae bacterium]